MYLTTARKEKGMMHCQNGYDAATGVIALVISSEDDHFAGLRNVFHSCKWKIHWVGSMKDGMSSLRYMSPVVVICDDQLIDGDWKLVLSAIGKLDYAPPVIVTSRVADNHMWAEVLHLCGHDLLAKPYVDSEVIYTVASAWRRAVRDAEDLSLRSASLLCPGPSAAPLVKNAELIRWRLTH
jgi:DNA-binding response OmpR family regulator